VARSYEIWDAAIEPPDSGWKLGVVSGPFKRTKEMAGYRSQDDDAFIDQDIGYPNPESEYRRYRYMRAFVFGAGILAVVLGLMEGGRDVLGAFTSFSSLLEGAAWARLFAALGTLARVGLVVVVVALFWRWRRRRSAPRRRKQKAP
jgi:hypothetical protein